MFEEAVSKVGTASFLLDIAQIIDTYKGGGTSAYHPRMMLKVVLYGYLNNIYSSRKIEHSLADRISFMWLSGDQQPDHNTINRFRSCRLKEEMNEALMAFPVYYMLYGRHGGVRKEPGVKTPFQAIEKNLC